MAITTVVTLAISKIEGVSPSVTGSKAEGIMAGNPASFQITV
jgi:hypothetical protein